MKYSQTLSSDKLEFLRASVKDTKEFRKHKKKIFQGKDDDSRADIVIDHIHDFLEALKEGRAGLILQPIQNTRRKFRLVICYKISFCNSERIAFNFSDQFIILNLFDYRKPSANDNFFKGPSCNLDYNIKNEILSFAEKIGMIKDREEYMIYSLSEI